MCIEGDLTVDTALERKSVLLGFLDSGDDGSGEVLQIDLAGVTELDTAGLQLLLMLKGEAAVRDVVLTLEGHSQAVLALVALTRLHEELDAVPGGTAPGATGGRS